MTKIFFCISFLFLLACEKEYSYDNPPPGSFVYKAYDTTGREVRIGWVRFDVNGEQVTGEYDIRNADGSLLDVFSPPMGSFSGTMRSLDFAFAIKFFEHSGTMQGGVIKGVWTMTSTYAMPILGTFELSPSVAT